jgi:transposase InsO family protein
MRPILAGDVWEVISIDISGPYVASNGYLYILSIQDLFSKFVQAFPMRNQTASEVATILFHNLFNRFGYPAHIISDQGKQFDGELFHELCRYANIHKIRTTAYRSSSNGQVERWHRTLHSMLAKVVQANHKNWHLHLPSVVLAYNCSINKSTRYTPNYLFFGRDLRLPTDLQFGLDPRAQHFQSQDAFVDDLTSRQVCDFNLARQHLQQAAESRKRYYDYNVKPVEDIKLGDQVLYYYPRKYQGRVSKLDPFIHRSIQCCTCY